MLWGILVLEAGSFIYPTHVYNICRFPNASLAKHFGCDTFWQAGGPQSEHFIGEKPQLAFGGRSIFWSGLIPSIQGWELDFFPPRVRQDLESGLLNKAGETMNESRSMGSTAQAVVTRLRQSSLAHDFSIQETPRALHQPYLAADGTLRMPFKSRFDTGFDTNSVVDEDLRVAGTQHLYVCDMSVMPFGEPGIKPASDVDGAHGFGVHRQGRSSRSLSAPCPYQGTQEVE